MIFIFYWACLYKCLSYRIFVCKWCNIYVYIKAGLFFPSEPHYCLFRITYRWISINFSSFYNSALYSFSINSPAKATWPFFNLNINRYYKLQFFLFHLEISLHTLSTLYLLFSLSFSYETITGLSDYVWVYVYTLWSCVIASHYEFSEEKADHVYSIPIIFIIFHIKLNGSS